MLGGMFAGHDESGGETIEKHGKKFKQFRDQVMNLALNSKYHSEHRSVLSDEEEMDEDNLSDSTGKLYADMKVESTEGAERMNSVVVNTDESEEDTSD